MGVAGYRLGDIIEFKDAIEDNGSWSVDKSQTYVDRISSVEIFYNPDMSINHIELWMDHYAEMPGRSCTIPDHVVRLIEPGKNPEIEIPLDPPIKVGTKVNYEDSISGKKFMRADKIKSHSWYHSFDEQSLWQYVMSDGGYSMTDDGFEVVK